MERRDTRECFERAVGMIARGLANAVAEEMVTHNYQALEHRLCQTLSMPDVRTALVTDLSGQLLSRAERANAQNDTTVYYGPARIREWTSIFFVHQ